ncbi:hypothetical protein [Streptomyces sp. MNP-20]|uniref:hypothetical protein n=1 Tax=Streptomyces sp. MNP-20 TaxID=2721165 RepID=UPI0015570867|nr:hypothetical protein [Streptomyces sp. MNP-20]
MDAVGWTANSFLPVSWTSYTPADVRPYLEELERVRTPLAADAPAQETEQRERAVQKATARVEAARKWTPDRPVQWDTDRDAELQEAASDLVTPETPAIVDDNGTLRMVYTRIIETVHMLSQGRRGMRTSLRLSEAEYVPPAKAPGAEAVGHQPAGVWRETGFIHPEQGLSNQQAPALAMFNGQVHLVHLHGWQLNHLIRGTDGTWKTVTGPDGTPVATPKVGMAKASRERGAQGSQDLYGLNANVRLAVHDGQLHLVHRLGEGAANTLTHCVFDGTTWTTKGTLPATNQTSRTAALASYDGKLHAVYPNADEKNSALRHTWWTAADGWAPGVDLVGHDSDNTPALLVFTEGPAGEEREAMLMVHRGIERWVESPPPAPPIPPEVVSTEATVYGPWVVDEGPGGWSRLRHRTTLTPATLDDGKQVLIAVWEARAEYYWLSGHHPDPYTKLHAPRISGGTLWLDPEGSKFNIANGTFEGGTVDKDGSFRGRCFLVLQRCLL